MLLDSLFHNETINTVFSFDTYKGFEIGEKKCEKKKTGIMSTRWQKYNNNNNNL